VERVAEMWRSNIKTAAMPLSGKLFVHTSLFFHVLVRNIGEIRFSRPVGVENIWRTSAEKRDFRSRP
jgi:hypothetical protein